MGSDIEEIREETRRIIRDSEHLLSELNKHSIRLGEFLDILDRYTPEERLENDRR